MIVFPIGSSLHLSPLSHVDPLLILFSSFSPFLLVTYTSQSLSRFLWEYWISRSCEWSGIGFFYYGKMWFSGLMDHWKLWKLWTNDRYHILHGLLGFWDIVFEFSPEIILLFFGGKNHHGPLPLQNWPSCTLPWCTKIKSYFKNVVITKAYNFYPTLIWLKS